MRECEPFPRVSVTATSTVYRPGRIAWSRAFVARVRQNRPGARTWFCDTLGAQIRLLIGRHGLLPLATLTRPDRPGIGTIGGRGGRQGVHTEQLGHMLAEMQSLARQHPGARW